MALAGLRRADTPQSTRRRRSYTAGYESCNFASTVADACMPLQAAKKQRRWVLEGGHGGFTRAIKIPLLQTDGL